jgi:hypothetical protein
MLNYSDLYFFYIFLVSFKFKIMKKLLLLFFGFGGLSSMALAQPQGGVCVPDPQYADSVYGAWPDTLTNFPPAEANAYYETILNFKAPAEVTADLDPSGQFVGSPIDEYVVTSVDGLPTGYTYTCNATNCTYTGGTQGCATVYGTTATTGTYSITINIDVTVLVTLFPGLPPTPVTQSTSFQGYKIVVGTAGQLEQIIAPLTVIPNPAKNNIIIDGITSSMKASSISITNIEGKVITTKNIEASNSNSFDISELKSGIYFINVNHASGVEKVKFIKE